jgi:hypothetical protein
MLSASSHTIFAFRRQTATALAYLLILMSLLSISYLMFVVPVYGYMGFNLEVNKFKFIEAGFLLFVSFVAVRRQQELVTGQFLAILYLFIIPPTICYYMLSPQSRIFIYGIVGGFLVTSTVMQLSYVTISWCWSVIQRSISYKFANVLLQRSLQYKILVYPLLVVIPLTVFGGLFIYNGLPALTALNLTQVYEVRESVVYCFSILPYLLNWQANVFNPTLITIGLHKRKASFIATGGTLQVLLFLYTGHKSMIFSIPLVVVTYILVSNRAVFLGLMKTFCVVISGALASYLVIGHTLLPSIFIRRLFFVPPMVRSSYFDFFTSHPYINLETSSLGFLWSSPYTKSVSTLIGGRYLDGANANIGYLASAFADFGILGVIFFALVLGVILSTIEVSSYPIPMAVTSGIWVVPLFNVTASRLTTAILTHGLLFAFLVTVVTRKLYFKNPAGEDKIITRSS